MAYRSNINDHSSILDHLLRYIGLGSQFNESLHWVLYNVFFVVGLGSGDVENNDKNVTSLCACMHLYIV